jgi:carboxymethylenebutenolidase
VQGAVVVLQEIFGVNAHIRSEADGFAAQGYLALAPSTFHRVKPGIEMGCAPDDIASGGALKTLVEGLPMSGVQ